MHKVFISSDVQQLTGVGEEWLMSKDGSLVLAKFMNGSFDNEYHPPLTGDTLSLEDKCAG